MSETIQKAAVVTGAASGIGRAIALRLAGRGDAVCLVDLVPLDDLVHELTQAGAIVTGVQGDVSSRATMRQAVNAATALGELSFVALNAGLLSGEADIARLSEERYQRVVSSNMHGVVQGIAAIIDAPSTRRVNVVVTNSSAGLVAVPHDPVYSMTKHAVIGLVRCIALNPAYEQIRVNCICPHGVDTPMVTEAMRSGRKMISADEVAKRVLELFNVRSSGDAWICKPDLFEPFSFPSNPGYEFAPLDAGSAGRSTGDDLT
jgi:NAD(P)-dependent dehydrogenase (short-subunit alcohol dehydrogenase family)